MAMVCCLACRSQPTIFISASFVPSLFGWIPQSLLGPLWGRRRYDISYVQESTEVTGNRVRACLFSVYEPEDFLDHFCGGSEHRSSRYSSIRERTSRTSSHGPN